MSLKIPNSDDVRDVADRVYSSALMAASHDNADSIIRTYNYEQARLEAELEEKICKLRTEIAMNEAALKLTNSKSTPPVPMLPANQLFEPGRYCDGCPYENKEEENNG